jgi:hypothetical protein
MGVYFDLFMMKNTARVVVAEGYIGGTQASGLVNHMFRFSSPDSHAYCYASRRVTAGLFDNPPY